MEPPDGISPLTGTTKEPLLPSEDTARKRASLGTRWASALILHFPASRTERNKHLLFKPPSLWHSVLAAWVKTPSYTAQLQLHLLQAAFLYFSQPRAGWASPVWHLSEPLCVCQAPLQRWSLTVRYHVLICCLPREKAEAASVLLFLSLPCPQTFNDVGSYSPFCPHIIYLYISSFTQQTSIACTVREMEIN